MKNPYCEALGIEVPSLDAVTGHREANTFALLMVALLERGEPMTLAEVAGRFEAAGVCPTAAALRSLKRCRPARAPVYRDGDHYELDPHDGDLDLWVFRLGLRPPKASPLKLVRPPPEPLPGPEEMLTARELEEAFRDGYLESWSAQRLALAVLDSRGGRMPVAEVLEIMNRLSRRHCLRERSAQYWRRGAAVRATEDGDWVIDPSHRALRSAREAVRKRVEAHRRQQAGRMDPVAIAVQMRRSEARQAAHAEELARLRRVLVHAFPKKKPEALVLVDVATRELTTCLHGELGPALAELPGYDLIGGLDVRSLLRELGFDPQTRRLAELGPPRKTRKLNRRGRTLKITTELLIQGSCGISRPFGSEARLRQYLEQGQTTRLRRRLEADAKSLFALYQYGRLHGAVRLKWGFLDEVIPAPWVHRDERMLYHLKREAHDRGEKLEVVTGNAPGWADPWSRGRRCSVARDSTGYGFVLVDDIGLPVDEWEVQLARVVPSE